jgi:hypothetical protein
MEYSLHAITKFYLRKRPTFAKFSHKGPSCNAKLSHNMPLLHHLGSSGNYRCPLAILHARLLSEVSLISKQVISYWTRGGTDSSGVSTPNNRSLANSSKTNHKLWRPQPFPPYHSLLKPQYRTTTCELTSQRMEDHNSHSKPQANSTS